MLAHRERAHLVIIDIQDRLAPAIDEVGSLIANAVRLNRYAAHFDVPVILTEQMPDRIGATLSEIGDLAPPQAVTVPKSTFSCWRTDAFKQRMLDLRQQGRDQIIVAGMEAHVCVMQTALELLAADFDVFVVADAVGSRTPDNRKLALERMAKAGATIVSHEMVAFEWLERADTSEFKALLPLFK
jgi:isochorismate hydrolase